MASWNDRSWPLRRWLCDRLIGDNAYSRNVASVPPTWSWSYGPSTNYGSTGNRFKVFDQEAS
jgi:hypothetical protein